MVYSETETLKIIEQCPRFERCSVNFCPLDLNQSIRESLKDDPESKCALGRKRRFKIGQNTELPLQGLTLSEHSAKRCWDSKSNEEKEKLKNRSRDILQKYRNKQNFS